MDTQDVSDPKQRTDAGVRFAGLDVLIHGAAHVGREEHGLLRSVLADPYDADPVADGASLSREPLFVIGQVGHPTNARLKIITSQPGIPGFL